MVPSSIDVPEGGAPGGVALELAGFPADLEGSVERTVAGRQSPDVGSVAGKTRGVRGPIGLLREGRAPRVLEVVDALPAHVRILDLTEIHPDVRILMPEERREVDVLVSQVGAPDVGAAPLRPRRRVDGMGRRSEGEDVEDHRLVVAGPVVGVEALLGRPAHRHAGRARLYPGPLDAPVECVGVGPDLRLDRIVPVEVALAGKRAGHEKRRVDGRQLDLLEPGAGLHVEEVVEETPIARHARGRIAGRSRHQEAQGFRGARRGIGPGDPAPFGADRVSGQSEAHGGHARERGRRSAIRNEAPFPGPRGPRTTGTCAARDPRGKARPPEAATGRGETTLGSAAREAGRQRARPKRAETASAKSAAAGRARRADGLPSAPCPVPSATRLTIEKSADQLRNPPSSRPGVAAAA